MGDRRLSELDRPAFEAVIRDRRLKRFEEVDSWPADRRALVHEYGLSVVKAFLECGVTKTNHIRHLVERVLDEFSPTRGTGSSQGQRRAVGLQERNRAYARAYERALAAGLPIETAREHGRTASAVARASGAAS